MANTVIEQNVAPPPGKPVKAGKAEPAEKPKKKKKKKKKKESVPVHERAWFLITCLLVLIGATAWLMHRGEDWYKDKWRGLMDGDSYAQREARDIADKYRSKYSKGQFVREALDVSDEVNSRSLEEQLRALAKRPRAEVSEFKSQCVKVVKQEIDEGLLYTFEWDDVDVKPLQANPLRVMQKWRQLLVQSETMDLSEDETRWLVRVCEKHHDHFRRKLIESPNAETFLRERMLEAEELEEENESASLVIWQYTFREFEKVDRFREFSEYSFKRNNRQSAAVPEVRRSRQPAEAKPATVAPSGALAL